MRLPLCAIFVILGSLQGCATAPWSRPAPSAPLETIRATPGEAQEDTLLRAAVVLQAFTRKTGFEACGFIYLAAGDQLVIPLATSGAHAGCDLTASILADVQWTGETIHSHPFENRFLANFADLSFINQGHEASVSVNTPQRVVNPEQFSREDILGPPGYLVTRGRLLYRHDNSGKVFDRGEVASPAP
jgi:hypothetical protein